MARKVFYSFHYQPDNWRVSQVRKMGALEGNQLLSDNAWEEVTEGGDSAIKDWIADQMAGKSCAVVLIGSATANRKWINYEIERAWNDGKAILGVHIHNLKDVAGNQTYKGANPFEYVYADGVKLSTKVSTYDPPYSVSTNVYDYIAQNIAGWVETAIEER